MECMVKQTGLGDPYFCQKLTVGKTVKRPALIRQGALKISQLIIPIALFTLKKNQHNVLLYGVSLQP